MSKFPAPSVLPSPIILAFSPGPSFITTLAPFSGSPLSLEWPVTLPASIVPLAGLSVSTGVTFRFSTVGTDVSIAIVPLPGLLALSA